MRQQGKDEHLYCGARGVPQKNGRRVFKNRKKTIIKPKFQIREKKKVQRKKVMKA